MSQDKQWTCLIVDDNARTRETLETLISEEGFEPRVAATLGEARAHAAECQPDLAIVDLDLPDGHGLELVEELQKAGDTEILILTGHGSVDTAVDAMRSGVLDFLTKPVEPARLLRGVDAARGTLVRRAEVRDLREQLREDGCFAGMVGRSDAMQEVFDKVTKVAVSNATVLVLGETGAGKELVARAVHELSMRREAPFIAVNCAAIQETLIESELFGHEAGAFTGATKRREGLFEQAQGGTLFLDEILEMPAELQVRLLRVLETRQLRRVGGNKDIDVDVRLVAATNKDPLESVEDGDVRQDLVYRLMVFPVHLPPLRERGDDISLLAQHFLDDLNASHGAAKSFTPEASAALTRHDWPGNVRELRNIVERAYILGEDEIDESCIVLDHWPSSGPEVDGSTISIPVGTSIADAERVMIQATLEAYDGDKPRAAQTLGISLRTLYNRLESYGESGD